MELIAERPAEAAVRSRLIVVYQMGKVGSTSLVRSLGALPGVEALQPHFLGPKSLREMITPLIDPLQSDYFHKHRLGQFVANLDITRRIEAVRRGSDTDTALAVVSLVREPIDWFRSCIVQDIEGYLPVLDRMAEHRLLPRAENDSTLRVALPWALEQLADALERAGGVDTFLDRDKPFATCFGDHPAPIARDLRALLAVMLRPYGWLEDHLYQYLDLTADDFARVEGGTLRAAIDWAEIFVLRYEDIEVQAAAVASALGLDDFKLGRENVSGSKPYANAIRSAFETAPGTRLKTLAQASTFARRHGYDG